MWPPACLLLAVSTRPININARQANRLSSKGVGYGYGESAAIARYNAWFTWMPGLGCRPTWWTGLAPPPPPPFTFKRIHVEMSVRVITPRHAGPAATISSMHACRQQPQTSFCAIGLQKHRLFAIPFSLNSEYLFRNDILSFLLTKANLCNLWNMNLGWYN